MKQIILDLWHNKAVLAVVLLAVAALVYLAIRNNSSAVVAPTQQLGTVGTIPSSPGHQPGIHPPPHHRKR